MECVLRCLLAPSAVLAGAPAGDDASCERGKEQEPQPQPQQHEPPQPQPQPRQQQPQPQEQPEPQEDMQPPPPPPPLLTPSPIIGLTSPARGPPSAEARAARAARLALLGMGAAAGGGSGEERAGWAAAAPNLALAGMAGAGAAMASAGVGGAAQPQGDAQSEGSLARLVPSPQLLRHVEGGGQANAQSHTALRAEGAAREQGGAAACARAAGAPPAELAPADFTLLEFGPAPSPQMQQRPLGDGAPAGGGGSWSGGERDGSAPARTCGPDGSPPTCVRCRSAGPALRHAQAPRAQSASELLRMHPPTRHPFAGSAWAPIADDGLRPAVAMDVPFCACAGQAPCDGDGRMPAGVSHGAHPAAAGETPATACCAMGGGGAALPQQQRQPCWSHLEVPSTLREPAIDSAAFGGKVARDARTGGTDATPTEALARALRELRETRAELGRAQLSLSRAAHAQRELRRERDEARAALRACASPPQSAQERAGAAHDASSLGFVGGAARAAGRGGRWAVSLALGAEPAPGTLLCCALALLVACWLLLRLRGVGVWSDSLARHWPLWPLAPLVCADDEPQTQLAPLGACTPAACEEVLRSR